jgi:acetylornithine deacetylase/succinyl-diaminopimelate desuccinylase-like protein
MTHVDRFDELLAEQPSDWAFFEVYIALDDPLRLNEARVALARANARPLKEPGGHDFAITVASTQGHGAAPGVVRSALALLDRLEIAGHTWGGEAYAGLRPAPPHRYGP